MNLIAGITLMDFVMNDHPRVILHQLHRTTKFDRLIEFSLHDSPGMRIEKRNNPLGNRSLPSKLFLGLFKQFFGQLDLRHKLLFEWGGRRLRQLLKSLTTVLQSVGSQLGDFLEHFFALDLTLFRFGFGTLAPTGQGSLGGTHVIDYLFAQRAGRAGERPHRLMQDPDVTGISDVGFQSRRIDANAAWLDRASLNQRFNEMTVELGHSLLAESVVEFNQRGGIGDCIHQRQMAEVAPRQPFSYLGLDFFVAQPPAKLQIHHAQIDPDRCAGAAHAIIEDFFEGLEQNRIRQKLVDFPKFLIQLVQRGVDKAVAKTHLLRNHFTHDFFYINPLLRPKKIVTFSVRTSVVSHAVCSLSKTALARRY